jgi:hypothetical protein
MRKLRCALVLSIAAVGQGLAIRNAAPAADLVLLDGRILTVDDRFRAAAALAVRDGRFIAVGSNEEVRRYIGSTTRVIDGGGRTVVPGLIDTHVHALDVAEAEATQPFRSLRSIGELQAWVRSEAERPSTRSARSGQGDAWIWTPPLRITRWPSTARMRSRSTARRCERPASRATRRIRRAARS